MKINVALAAGFATCFLAASAPAATLKFEYKATSGDSAKWTQSDTPTVLYYDTNDFYSFTDVAVTHGEGISGNYSYTFTDVTFDFEPGILEPGTAGGFATNTPNGANDSGHRIYTGDESAPVFSAGTYVLDNGTLTVTSAVPEPAAWSMMLLGTAAVGGLARARRRLAATA